MKTKILVLVLVLAGFKLVCAQNVDNVKNLPSIVWFGLDFSKAKLIGTPLDFADLTKIKNTYFAAWNNLILKEYPKYDIGKAYNKTYVEKSIQIAIDRSVAVDTNSLILKDPVQITQNELTEVLKEYNIATENETGLLYIIESLDKTNSRVTAWVVFFKIRNGEILYAIKSEGRVGGYGFRNYWIKGIYNILNNTGSKFQPIDQW